MANLKRIAEHTIDLDLLTGGIVIDAAVQHERTAQHGAGFNYWDSLFIRKDLL